MTRLMIIGTSLFFILQINASAQQKFERESRLKPDNVPPEALQFIKAVEMNTRWKWYFEENLEGNSVEAKTKYNGRRYSVEFDTTGIIQDIEVETKWQEMDEHIRSNISESLDSLFTRHNIIKIQIQYSAEKPVLLAILNNKAEFSESRIQYEIEVKGKETGRPKLYELTFTELGKLTDISEIIFRNTDNLEY
ncbi:MAG: hypothetical protein PHH93_05115 [Prolixibacteraceae bacterium]|nr:hypothetical protein [Prolixibacteraceae bacterium]